MALDRSWLLKFLHTLEVDQGCLAHTLNWDGGPPKKFKREHSKISLKFITSVYNFGASGNNTRKLYQATYREVGVITWVQILEVVPPTKFGKAKNVKNLVRFLTTFDFDRKYLQKRTVQLKSEKHLINHISSPIGRKKCGELWSTNKKVIGTHVDPPK